MPRYIDADALARKLQSVLDSKPEDKGTVAYQVFEAFIERLALEPTIDVERGGRLRGVTYDDGKVTEAHIMDTDDAVKVFKPVVRCRDCKHCDPENHHCDHYMGTAAPLRREPDDFCSYGERRKFEPKYDAICGATNLPCIKCNPGGCSNRKEGADNG